MALLLPPGALPASASGSQDTLALATYTQRMRTMIDEPDIDCRAMELADEIIETMKAQGITADDIGHALISAGLAHLRGNVCDDHLLEQLGFIRAFVSARMDEVRGTGAH